MSAHIFDHSVNIVGLIKNSRKIGMTCAWTMQVDDDKVLLLLGRQSYTAHCLDKSDIVGISTLSKEQKALAEVFGDNHSDIYDKYENIDYIENKGSLLIKDAYMQMVVIIEDIIHLNEIEEDYLIYAKIIYKNTNNTSVLHMNDF